MKATRAPAAVGAVLYHSMLIQVSTCPTSFHQLYSMMKLAMALVEPKMSANSTASRIRLRICEGRIKQDFRFGTRFRICPDAGVHLAPLSEPVDDGHNDHHCHDNVDERVCHSATLKLRLGIHKVGSLTC